MTTYEKLFKVQQELKAPKGQHNDFGNYFFRSCEDILTAVKPLLAEVKAVVTLSDEVEILGDRYYIKATASFIDIENNERISNTASAREEDTKKGMDASQITGASSSYARKYALNGLFGIDDVKDSDSTNHGIEIETKEDAEKLEMPFGKYKGKTFKEILANDKQYLEWLLNSDKVNDIMKKAIPMLIGNPLTKEEQDELLALTTKMNMLVISTNSDYNKIFKAYKVNGTQDMSKEQILDCIKILESKLGE